MPHYYFHLHDDVDCRDPEGRRLPDLSTARQFALKSARLTAGQTVKDMGHIFGSHRIDIETAQSRILDTVFFRDAVHIES